ncbi:hypothetical protein CDAR_486751 [Caerostris darwini]|uniref:Uncharacterized protein n=1 Tax=Caerostris darwini TaxID=1538125 RepID=A0AAV4P2Y1_9ARAC|nr:hypothetical protein CDAR_486751 [Caerostris darwini]
MFRGRWEWRVGGKELQQQIETSKHRRSCRLWGVREGKAPRFRLARCVFTLHVEWMSEATQLGGKEGVWGVGREVSASARSRVHYRLGNSWIFMKTPDATGVEATLPLFQRTE